MGIMSRDYMDGNYENDYKRVKERRQRQAELFRLYAKNHKTIFDRMKIKKLEKENLEKANW